MSRIKISVSGIIIRISLTSGEALTLTIVAHHDEIDIMEG